MALRKLTDKPASQADSKPVERLEREVAETAVRRYQDGQRPLIPSRGESAAAYHESNSQSTATDLQTPPPSHKELRDITEMLTITPPVPTPGPSPSMPVAPENSMDVGATPSNTADSFAAALEALRATLRQPIPPMPDSQIDRANSTGSETMPVIETPIDMESESSPVAAPAAPVPPAAPAKPTALAKPAASIPPLPVEDVVSALERMPLPPAVDGPAPTPRPLYEDPLLKVQRRKNTPAPQPLAARETPSIDSALEAVRHAVPGLRVTPLKPDTPTNGRETPLSDGIPKSISEDLPKYSARPKMRICGRCGHETKLRNAKCEKCAHVDESLGILDAVIAGDIVRVEQVLLVRPGLITLRTSRHDWTLLHMAASGGNPKMVDLLLAKGASVNAANRDGKTALHYAAGKGHLGIVQALLANHADATMLYGGKSALDLARKAGHRDVADVIRAVMPEGDLNA